MRRAHPNSQGLVEMPFLLPFGVKLGVYSRLSGPFLVLGLLVAASLENGWKYIGTGAIGTIRYRKDTKMNFGSIDVLAIARLERGFLVNKVHGEGGIDVR